MENLRKTDNTNPTNQEVGQFVPWLFLREMIHSGKAYAKVERNSEGKIIFFRVFEKNGGKLLHFEDAANTSRVERELANGKLYQPRMDKQE